MEKIIFLQENFNLLLLLFFFISNILDHYISLHIKIFPIFKRIFKREKNFKYFEQRISYYCSLKF